MPRPAKNNAATKAKKHRILWLRICGRCLLPLDKLNGAKWADGHALRCCGGKWNEHAATCEQRPGYQAGLRAGREAAARERQVIDAVLGGGR